MKKKLKKDQINNKVKTQKFNFFKKKYRGLIDKIR